MLDIKQMISEILQEKIPSLNSEEIYNMLEYPQTIRWGRGTALL